MKTMMKTALTASVLSLLVLGATSAQALTSLAKETDIEAVALKVAKETVQGDYKLLAMEEVKQMLDAGEDFVLVDAHPRWQFEMAHIGGAKHFGFQSKHVGTWEEDVTDSSRTKDDYRAVLGQDLDKKIVIYCGFIKCGRSHNAASWAKELGYTNVYRAPGGITAWKDLGYPYKVVPNEDHTYPNR